MSRLLHILLIICLLLTPSFIQACSCGRISIEDAFRSSDAVFIGKVISIEPKVGTVHRWIIATYDNLTNKDIDDSLFDMEVKLEVTKLWKGGATKSLTIVTPDPDVCCICGFEFQVGQSYLVYADGTPLSTSICSRTKPLSDTATEATELDRLVAHLRSGK